MSESLGSVRQHQRIYGRTKVAIWLALGKAAISVRWRVGLETRVYRDDVYAQTGEQGYLRNYRDKTSKCKLKRSYYVP
jgi:hypothetical protein